MRNLAPLAPALLLLALPALAQDPALEGQTVRVATWNLLHAARRNDERLALVAAELAPLAVDALGLQEASRSLLLARRSRARVLGEALGLSSIYRMSDGVPFLWDEGPAVLVRGPLVRTARARLAHSWPVPFEARTVLLAETRLLQGALPFCLASTHLGLGGEVENLEQALDALELVAREALARGVPAVLVGDLNAEAGHLAMRALTGRLLGGEPPLLDAWRATRGDEPGLTSDPDGDDPALRIDYVLVLRGTDPALRPVSARLLGEEGPARAASDHRGVLVELQVERAGAGITAALAGRDAPATSTPAAQAEALLARIARLRERISALRAEARRELLDEARVAHEPATLAARDEVEPGAREVRARLRDKALAAFR